MGAVICPSCGAENAHYGKCEYCGTKLIEPSRTNTVKQTAKVSAEDFATKISKYQKVENFRGGVTVVTIGNQSGAINENGDLIVSMTSENVVNLSTYLFCLVLVGDRALYDSKGDVLLEDKRINYLGSLSFVLENSEGAQRVAQASYTNGKLTFEIIPVNLPDSVKIIGSISHENKILGTSESLGYGCYVVMSNSKPSDKKFGIATTEKVLLECSSVDTYRFYLPKEFKHLITVIGRKSTNYGIFNLETQKLILPCEYHYSYHEVKDGFLIIRHDDTFGAGVFDLNKEKIVVPTIYNSITLKDYHVCVTRKKGFWGWKTETIKL